MRSKASAALFSLMLLAVVPLMHSQPGVLLRLHFVRGQMITQRAAIVDRIAWVLPKKRLEQFRRSGIVIEEEGRTTIVSRAVVERIRDGEVSLTVDTSSDAIDVPRHRSAHHHELSEERITVFNAPSAGQQEPLDVVEAATAEFSRMPVHVGSRWTTTERVSTTLGSGLARFVHTIAAITSKSVRIDITGRGSITGAEYNLPKLLPGSIELRGQAWYDRASGLVVRERYSVRNRLLKPAGTEQIGFDERETVEIVVSSAPRTLR